MSAHFILTTKLEQVTEVTNFFNSLFSSILTLNWITFNSEGLHSGFQRSVTLVITMCCSKKYPNPSHGRFLAWTPTPFRNSILVPYFPLKNWACETSLPLGISINLPWGGYGYFLELHNIQATKYTLTKKSLMVEYLTPLEIFKMSTQLCSYLEL